MICTVCWEIIFWCVVCSSCCSRAYISKEEGEDIAVCVTMQQLERQQIALTTINTCSSFWVSERQTNKRKVSLVCLFLHIYRLLFALDCIFLGTILSSSPSHFLHLVLFFFHLLEPCLFYSVILITKHFAERVVREKVPDDHGELTCDKTSSRLPKQGSKWINVFTLRTKEEQDYEACLVDYMKIF